MPPPEAVSAAVNVFFYFCGGLGGLAICLNQTRQFFRAERSANEQFATVGQLKETQAEVKRVEDNVTSMRILLAGIAGKLGVTVPNESC